MQIKVKDTRMQEVNKVTSGIPNRDVVPVTEAKLVLVNEDKFNSIEKLLTRAKFENRSITTLGIKPILISETEKDVDECPVLCLDELEHGWNEAYRPNGRGKGGTCNGCKKILALPEHFSPKHLQAIVDGKLKDGDKVLVECERVWVFRAYTTEQAYRTERFFDEKEFTDHTEMKVFSAKHSAEHKRIYPNYVSNYTDYHKIKLNSSNHITLHKVEEKMYTREEVEVLAKQSFEVGRNYQLTGDNNFKEWFDTNVK